MPSGAARASRRVVRSGARSGERRSRSGKRTSGGRVALSSPALQRLTRKLSGGLERRVINPVVRRLVFAGKLSSTYALLETTGRRTGLPRLTPVANGLRGDTFWLISAHGRHASYFRNLLAEPRVRVGLGQEGRLRWRAGEAHPLWDDDASSRHRQLGRGRFGYWLDGLILRATATQMTTVRIDLAPD